MNISRIIDSCGVLLLMIGTNYTGSMLPCNVRHMLTHNWIVQHILVILLIMLFIVILNEDGHKNWVIPDILLTTLYVYIMFIMLSKTSLLFSLPVTISAIAIILIHTELSRGTKTERELYILNTIRDILVVVVVSLVFVGFMWHTYEYIRDESRRFPFIQFIFSPIRCDHDGHNGH